MSPEPRALRRAGSRRPEPLLLDEMFAPALAAALNAEGFDVLAVAGHAVLATAPDQQVARWAREADRRLVTENVRDFAPLLRQDDPPLRVLFTSSRRFPRSRHNPSPLRKALHAWLAAGTPHADEEWLR